MPCQVKLRPATAERLRRALAIPGFEDALARFLDDALIDTDAYPNLRLLCWNRSERFIPAREAFSLYERNWRLVDEKTLGSHERELIDRLMRTHGAGVLNV